MPRTSPRSDKAAEVAAVLANARRLEIMYALVLGELSVGAIAQQVSLSKSEVSQHLAKLRRADLVKTRRDAQTIFYSTRSPEVEALLRRLKDIADNTDI